MLHTFTPDHDLSVSLYLLEDQRKEKEKERQGLLYRDEV